MIAAAVLTITSSNMISEIFAGCSIYIPGKFVILTTTRTTISCVSSFVWLQYIFVRVHSQKVWHYWHFRHLAQTKMSRVPRAPAQLIRFFIFTKSYSLKSLLSLRNLLNVLSDTGGDIRFANFTPISVVNLSGNDLNNSCLSDGSVSSGFVLERIW